MARRPYLLTTHDGKRVDWLTKAALLDAEAILGYPLTITQGSYNAGGVSASAGTHDGGGVVDLAPWDHQRKVAVLRRFGFAAWYRPELWRGTTRVWPPHIHAVQVGNAKLSPGARAQVDAYLAGRDGLAGNGPDTGPREHAGTVYRWQQGAVRVTRARRAMDRALAQLSTGIRGYRGIVPARRALRRAKRNLPPPT